jgi:hypothetical protein
MVPTITFACLGVNSILKLLTVLGINAPCEGETINYVNLKWYETGFKLGLNMLKGN